MERIEDDMRCSRSDLRPSELFAATPLSSLSTTRHLVLWRASTSLRENDLPHGHANGRISACRRSWRRRYSRREYDVLHVGHRNGGPCCVPDDGSVEVVGGGSDELEVLCSGAAEAGGGPDGTCIKSELLLAASLPTEDENVASASAAAACGPPDTFPRKSIVLYWPIDDDEGSDLPGYDEASCLGALAGGCAAWSCVGDGRRSSALARDS